MNYSVSVCILIAITSFKDVESRSLLNRYFSAEDGDSVIADPYEDQRVSDADVGMKSARFIGTFGTRTIESRQENTFVDQDGVPVPILPYHENYHANREDILHTKHNRHDHLGGGAVERFLERSRQG
ncbi:unnamed protein product [Caenorhabditis bovis]|uniref:Uncharacterized protein n=1 Tax=Caenorhabditis bovis TaxID=2654633 RepID=A0A8S1E257_9PELO|nr:unnamed protein product [Caenorhabditis bovis]